MVLSMCLEKSSLPYKIDQKRNQNKNFITSTRKIIKLSLDIVNKNFNQFKIELAGSQGADSLFDRELRSVNGSMISGASERKHNSSVNKFNEKQFTLKKNQNLYKNDETIETTILPIIKTNNGVLKITKDQFSNRRSFEGKLDNRKLLNFQKSRIDKGNELSSIISSYLKQDKKYENLKISQTSSISIDKTLKSRNYEIKLSVSLKS